jgi:hypothetical protein
MRRHDEPALPPTADADAEVDATDPAMQRRPDLPQARRELAPARCASATAEAKMWVEIGPGCASNAARIAGMTKAPSGNACRRRRRTPRHRG